MSNFPKTYQHDPSCGAIVSGIGIQEGTEKFDYYKVSESSIYLWSVSHPNHADHVYHGDPRENAPYSDGFAGRSMEFNTVSGEAIVLQGPYSCALPKSDWAKDIRKTHYSKCVVAKNREYQPWAGYYDNSIYSDIIHLDRDWVLGEWERCEKLAQEMADRLGEAVFLSVVTTGGGSAGAVKPRENQLSDEAA